MEASAGVATSRVRYHVVVNTMDCKTFLAELEKSPRMVQLRHAELESMVSWCMDEICGVAKSGEDKERKMELAALELRARLVLRRWKKRDLN